MPVLPVRSPGWMAECSAMRCVPVHFHVAEHAAVRQRASGGIQRLVGNPAMRETHTLDDKRSPRPENPRCGRCGCEAHRLRLGHPLPLRHGGDGRAKQNNARRARGGGGSPRNALAADGGIHRNAGHSAARWGVGSRNIPDVTLHDPALGKSALPVLSLSPASTEQAWKLRTRPPTGMSPPPTPGFALSLGPIHAGSPTSRSAPEPSRQLNCRRPEGADMLRRHAKARPAVHTPVRTCAGRPHALQSPSRRHAALCV